MSCDARQSAWEAIDRVEDYRKERLSNIDRYQEGYRKEYLDGPFKRPWLEGTPTFIKVIVDAHAFGDVDLEKLLEIAHDAHGVSVIPADGLVRVVMQWYAPPEKSEVAA